MPATAGDASDGLTEEAGDAPAELPLSAAASSDMLLVSFGEAGTDLLVPAGLLQLAGVSSAGPCWGRLCQVALVSWGCPG